VDLTARGLDPHWVSHRTNPQWARWWAHHRATVGLWSSHRWAFLILWLIKVWAL
jgi:hypothetical protein